jgi:hypothetical protein
MSEKHAEKPWNIFLRFFLEERIDLPPEIEYNQYRIKVNESHQAPAESRFFLSLRTAGAFFTLRQPDVCSAPPPISGERKTR